MEKLNVQQADAPDRATFSIIATAPSRKIENAARPVIPNVGLTRMTRNLKTKIKLS